MIINSEQPEIVAEQINLDVHEMMYYLYYPISLKGSADYIWEERLEFIRPLINEITKRDIGLCRDKYVYLTIKNMFVEPNSYGNRAGWHSDGFGTNDINYLWYSSNPTEFCLGRFDVSEDDQQSLLDFETQSQDNKKIYRRKSKSLIRLTTDNIHRVAINKQGGYRCFIKVSISDHEYNLKGNSINNLLDYDWKFHDRDKLRNMEHSDKDFKN